MFNHEVAARQPAGVNGRNFTSMASQNVPLPTQNGTSRQYTYPQSYPQRQISEGFPVTGAATAYTGIDGQSTSLVRVAADLGGNASYGVPTTLDYIGAAQNGAHSFTRRMIPTATVDGFVDAIEARVGEIFRRRYEQGLLGTYAESQSMYTTLSPNYPATGPSTVLDWHPVQSSLVESTATSARAYENPTRSFDGGEGGFGMSQTSFGHNHDPHPDSQLSPGSVPDGGSTVDPRILEDSSHSDSVQCGLRGLGCNSIELYDRESLWKHIKDFHLKSSVEGDRFACRWNACTDQNGFKDLKTLRRHIDANHAFPGRYKCTCGGRWGRKDKLDAHLSKLNSPNHQRVEN